jgi:hypothetical protein
MDSALIKLLKELCSESEIINVVINTSYNSSMEATMIDITLFFDFPWNAKKEPETITVTSMEEAIEKVTKLITSNKAIA